eukprot:2741754-Rhodomonas_salina.1
MEGDDELLVQAVKEACTDVSLAGLKAESFLVAWGGVLTLAFSAWPTPIRQLKQRLNDRAAWTARMAGNRTPPPLVPENDGSKWPKSSLAALKDGRELSQQELERLHAVCSNSDKILGGVSGLEVHGLSVVKYSCRSLENR